jgi:hypothetical protein
MMLARSVSGAITSISPPSPSRSLSWLVEPQFEQLLVDFISASADGRTF